MENTEKETGNLIINVLLEIKTVEEKFRKIQKNPALYGAENGLSSSEHKTLEKLISQIGEINLAANEIFNKGAQRE